MMNQIVPLNEKYNIVAGARPAAIVPKNMDEVYRLAQAVAISGIAPKDMQTAEKCTIAILHGLEVGLAPMTALQRIAIIGNRPTIWGDAALGLVEASGLSKYIKEWFEGEGDNRIAKCETHRIGKPEAVQREFSVSQAKTANLWGKAGPWQQYPDRMLQMRARAFCLRDVYPDVLGGLYIREEMDDSETPARTVAMAPPVPPEPPAIEMSPEIEVVEAEPEARDGIPAFLDRRKPKEAQAEIIDPSSILKQAEEAFASAATPEELEVLFDEFRPQLDFPPDMEALYANMKAHEKRIERSAP